MKVLKGKERILLVQTIIFSVISIGIFAYTATAQALLQIGTQPPDFKLQEINGNSVSLSQYSQKKAIVVLFWSTWSGKSANALKRFETFYKKYKDKGIQVIGINADNQTISDDDIVKIKNMTKDLNITFPILLDKGLKTFHTYEVIALPSILIITEGKIAYELPGLPLVGTEDMFDYLLVLAGEPTRKKIEPSYKPRHDAIADAGLAKSFVNKKRYEMAYPLYRKAIEKDPKYMLPYVELGRLYELEGKTKESEEILKKAVAVEPENVAALSELGYLLTKTGNIKEAVVLLDKAAKKDSYTPSYYFLAYAFGKSGQSKEALNTFEQAIALNPYDPLIYQLRAEIYEINKMPKEAASDYRKALELILKVKK